MRSCDPVTVTTSQPLMERQIVVSNENPNLRITTSLFDGQNFLSWSRSAILFLKSKGKMGYIDGTIATPSITDPRYADWDKDNSLVMNWLVHSMVPSLGEGYLNLTTSRDIWDIVADKYSRKGNIAQIYDLKRRIENQNQDELTLLQYFTTLTSLWRTFDHYQDFTPVCTIDMAANYQKLWKEIVSSSSWLVSIETMIKFDVVYWV